MNRYIFTVLVRPMDGGPEHAIGAKMTADTELEARRKVLEIAWFNRAWVSRFLKTTVRSLDDDAK